MQIERATTADIDEVAMLYDIINDHLAAGVNYPGWRKGEYPARPTAEAGVLEGSLYVARQDGRIVGAVILNSLQPDVYTQVHWITRAAPEEVLSIHTLVVHPDCMKMGIARRLVSFAQQLVREDKKLKTIRLDATVQNEPAIALYERSGFTYRDTVDLGLGIPGLVWFKVFEWTA